MDTPLRTSSPESDSPERGESSDRTANTVTRYECPDTFQRVEQTTDYGLCIDDIEESTELWLIKAPINFDARRLNTKISLKGRQYLPSSGDSDGSAYELHAQLSPNASSDVGLPHLLLTSGGEENLVAAPEFKGQLSIVETLEIPPVLLPPSPPKSLKELPLPPGLKQRFLPFGWEEPTKDPFKGKQSPDAIDSGVVKKKKRKSHRDKTSKEAPQDAVTQGDTRGDAERLPRDGETGVVKEITGERTKEHKKTKKRRQQVDEQRDTESRSRTNSEEISTKRTKKKHKNNTVIT